MNLILPFDTETTGLPDWKSPSDALHQPHIVQLSAHLVDAESRSILQTLDVIIKPDGWDIPPLDDPANVHGITTEFAHDVGISEKLAVEMLVDMLGDNLRVAHNTTFDNLIIRIALKRYLGDEIADKWKAGDYHCTMQQAKPIMKMKFAQRGGIKPPKLTEAYEFFMGKPLVNAHTAIADTNACLSIFWAMQDHY